MKNDLLHYLKRAQKEGWAIGQFNISNLEMLKAILNAASILKSPVIIGTSEGESRFMGLEQIAVLVNACREKTKLPIFLHLDHGKDLDYIKKAISAGYDSVQFDGSNFPLDKNIKNTKKIVQQAHKKGVLVEGEVGAISGVSELRKEKTEMKKEDLTDPDSTLKFVRETRVDSLAVNVGTLHGIEACGENPHINLQRLKGIKEKLGERAFIVLHGGSGTPEEDIKKAIKSGVVKVNINTELRLAFVKSLKSFLEKNPDEVKPYKIFPSVIESVQTVVEEKIKLFCSNNKI